MRYHFVLIRIAIIDVGKSKPLCIAGGNGAATAKKQYENKTPAISQKIKQNYHMIQQFHFGYIQVN